nr:immunoglobulin heavy chain junction region [Macaca mulatta]
CVRYSGTGADWYLDIW